MKKSIQFIIVLSMCISTGTSLAADLPETSRNDIVNMTVTPGSGKCGDNLEWSLDLNGTLTISGSGKMYEYTETDVIPWFENNNSRAISNIIVKDGVESICGGAFHQTSIVSLTLPDSVKELGSLSVSSCPNLEHIELSDNIEEIPESALYYNRELRYIHMPQKLKIIGNSAFQWCEKLEQIIIPEGLTAIGERAFAECHSLKKIVIPPGVKSLESGTFRLNTSLTELYLPPSLETIADTAVSGCANIDKIILPDGLNEIGMSAFDWADTDRSKAIKQIIYVPQSVKKLGKWPILGSNIEVHSFVGSEIEAYTKEVGIPFVAVKESMYSEEEYYKALNNQTEPQPEVSANNSAAPKANGTLTVKNLNGAVSIDVNSRSVIFPDAQPFIDENGRTQIPVRAVAEAMGAKVDWDNDTNTATVKKDGTTVTITIGDVNMSVGNKTVTMDTSAQIIDERTYIPVRFAGEALGMTVNWIGE